MIACLHPPLTIWLASPAHTYDGDYYGVCRLKICNRAKAEEMGILDKDPV